jgi:capsular polysaccharide biosynthesis protein
MGTNSVLTLVRQRWWLLLLGLLPTVVIAYVQASGQPPVYESTGTFVVRPVDTAQSERLRALDTLSRGVEISSTYANVVSSDRILEGAYQRLGLDANERSGVSASGNVVTGTYLLEIRAAAGSAELARDVAAAVGEESLEYINQLENAFGLEPLDAPTLPSSPAGPRARLALMVAFVLGSTLGVGLLVASNLLVPVRPRRRLDVLDPATGAYTSAFLLQRLGEEMSRLRRRGGALAVATFLPASMDQRVPVFPQVRRRDRLREVADSLRPLLRPDDVLAYVGAGQFAVLRPDVTDPDWPYHLTPAGTFRIAVRTFVGGDGSEPALLDDADAFVQHIEDELRRVAEAPPVAEPDDRRPTGRVGA